MSHDRLRFERLRFKRGMFELEVEDCARNFWERLLEKIGERKAKSMMLRLMGKKKPGPKNAEEGLLNKIIEGHLRTHGQESDEKIAKRILARKPCWVRYQSGDLGYAYGYKLSGDDLISVEPYVDGEYTVDAIVEQKPIVKGLESLEKRVQRVRQRLIEDGELPKEFAPKQYYHG
jgi:hypothetical protein